MCLDLQFQTIQLSSVDRDDETFRYTLERDRAGLRESIARFGLLAPPILRKSESRYQIVAGFARIQVLAELEVESFGSAVLDPCADVSAYEFGLEDNLSVRKLAPIEEAQALQTGAGHPGQRSDRGSNKRDTRTAHSGPGDGAFFVGAGAPGSIGTFTGTTRLAGRSGL